MDENKLDAFLNDIIEVYKKHGLSLAHEDIKGGFIVQKFKEENVDWLKQACYDNDYPKSILKNL